MLLINEFKEWLTEDKVLDMHYKLYRTTLKFYQFRKLKVADVLRQLDEGFTPPHLAKIPKDDFSFREVYCYKPVENFTLKLFNRFLFQKYSDKISKNCFSYLEGQSRQNVIKRVFSDFNLNLIYIKLDIKNYFLSVKEENRNEFLKNLGLYHYPFQPLFQNKYWDKEVLCEQNLGLLPGAPISAFLSNAYLKEYDDYVLEHVNCYYRYGDDMLIGVDPETDTEILISKLSEKIEEYGLQFNQSKTQIYDTGIVTFLGCNIDQNGYQMSEKRFKQTKIWIKSIAKQIVRKKDISKEARVVFFLKELNRNLLEPITKDYRRGGKLLSLLSCTTKIDRLQKLDFYILDKCRYVYSGKTNFGALKAGVTTSYLEEKGFVSLVKLFKYYKQHPLILGYECFKLLDKQRKRKIFDPEYVIERNGEIDIFELFLNDDVYFLNRNQWEIDWINGEIRHGSLILFSKNKRDHIFGENFKVLIDSHYELEEQTLIQILELTSYKTFFPVKSNTKIYNPVAYHYLPYDSYTTNSKIYNVQLTALILFLYRIGVLDLSFSSVGDYLVLDSQTVKLAIDRRSSDGSCM